MLQGLGLHSSCAFLAIVLRPLHLAKVANVGMCHSLLGCSAALVLLSSACTAPTHLLVSVGAALSGRAG